MLRLHQESAKNFIMTVNQEKAGFYGHGKYNRVPEIRQ